MYSLGHARYASFHEALWRHDGPLQGGKMGAVSLTLPCLLRQSRQRVSVQQRRGRVLILV